MICSDEKAQLGTYCFEFQKKTIMINLHIYIFYYLGEGSKLVFHHANHERKWRSASHNHCNFCYDSMRDKEIYRKEKKEKK